MQCLTFGIIHCDYRAVGLTGDIERCDGPNRAKGVDVVADIPRRVPPGIRHQELGSELRFGENTYDQLVSPALASCTRREVELKGYEGPIHRLGHLLPGPPGIPPPIPLTVGPVTDPLGQIMSSTCGLTTEPCVSRAGHEESACGTAPRQGGRERS